jgi:hypothetical protein
MAVVGDLTTMSLPDLLQWASLTQKSGVLELERNKVCRRIEFRKGWIRACSSDDPSSLLGQFLLARGKITQEQLRDALAEQERSRKHLGLIFLEMGALTQQELTRQVAAKAEETIQGLFDWDGAIFRFHEGATLEPNQIEVNLSVNDILFRGLQHHDELKEIRKVFKSSGIVLRQTEKPVPAELLQKPIARRIFESIDGNRTLAEILLHAHASEFLVTKLLYRLYRMKLLAITGERPVTSDAPRLLDAPAPAARPRQGPRVIGSGSSFEEEREPDMWRDREPDEVAYELRAPTSASAHGKELDAEVEVATRLMSRGEYEAALELLNASYRAHPGESYLRRLISKAEAAYVDTARRHDLSGDKIPVLLESPDGWSNERLSSEESFLKSLIDGETDIKGILWVAPLREVDGLRALREMLERGMITLEDPAPAEEPSEFNAESISEPSF